MSQKEIKEVAKKLFVGKLEIWIDGWSINGSGKWTAELALNGAAIPNMKGEGYNKRSATGALLDVVKQAAKHAEADG